MVVWYQESYRSSDLDNWITGHWGEDWLGGDDLEDYCESCPIQRDMDDCPFFQDGELCPLMIQSDNERNKQEAQMEDAMFQSYREEELLPKGLDIDPVTDEIIYR